MKKIFYYITLILFAFSSCEPMEEIYDEMEEMDTGFSGSFEYALVSDDYAAIAEAALRDNPGDTLNAAFIESNEYFNDSIKASDYVPYLIPELYPGLGLGSTGMISYNYNGDLPDDLSDYTEADEYELEDSDYQSTDSVLNYARYFSPAYPPEVYVPGILSENMDNPEEDEMVLVSYLHSDVDPKLDFSSGGENIVFMEGFTEEANGLGQFTAVSLQGAQEWGWDQYGDGNAKMSGYDGGAVENEDWLISPAIDLSDYDEVYLEMSQAINYLNAQWDQINMFISTDYDGSDVAGATWESFTVPNMPTGSSWDFVESGQVDISEYGGQTIYIGFQYLSTEFNAATWEIAEVKVYTPGSVGIIGKTPMEYSAFYQYDGEEWGKMDKVYYVNAADYDAMGSPGQYNNFSDSDKPVDYLPNLLDAKYPLAGQDEEVVVVYKYYMGRTLTLADRYTHNNGTWESSYNYIEERTSQFLYGNQGWVFDPTVTFSMTSDDYQIIVDWVDDNFPGEDYVDNFGTGEYYHGANSYYNNFDIRTGNFEQEAFDSWEDAVTSAIGNVLLPEKFPNAQTKVGGVDMFYIVRFATYSGADGSYSIKFQVTKSGPDPEFTLVEGPY